MKFVGRALCTAPRSRIVDHGVILKMTPSGPVLDHEAMRRRGMRVPDDGVSDAQVLSEPAQLAEMNCRNCRRYARDQAGGEGELRCTFPKSMVGSISGDDEFLHVYSQDGDTMATFFGHHEARQQDDGSTGIHYLGERPGAMEKRQPEPVSDRTVAGIIVTGSERDTPQGQQATLRAINERNRRHYGS